ncbi:flavin reductase [Micromonospora sp. NBC_01412]|uniref:flavin reductase n=1 Tax=Micromonospora sp. NBC_01412 TaxID=2903590 RepID=UPI00324F1635
MTRAEPPRPHLPMRPLWRCRACGAEWPCSPARLRLLREYEGCRVSLALYLVVMLNEAVQDAYRLGPDRR